MSLPILPNSYVETLTPAPQNVTRYRIKVFKEVIIKLKMRPLGWALLQVYWCPYEKRLDTELLQPLRLALVWCGRIPV